MSIPRQIIINMYTQIFNIIFNLKRVAVDGNIE